ncbi:Uncharacterised protein [Klebsiella pneumoniae]|nr:Uncharacterised protein [Klebsiella pneumoniae]
MFADPEIGFRRKRQEPFGVNIHIRELNVVFAAGIVTKPASGILLADVPVEHHDGVDAFIAFLKHPLLQLQIEPAGIFIAQAAKRTDRP